MELDNLGDAAHCRQVAAALSRASDKWTVLVFLQLEQRERRYSDLKRAIGGISPKMLASTLRHLERDGLIERTVFDTRPPTVVYALTDLGREMAAPIRALGMWVLQNLDRLEAARAAFDARGEPVPAP